MSIYRLSHPDNMIAALDLDVFVIASQIAKESQYTIDELILNLMSKPCKDNSIRKFFNGELQCDFHSEYTLEPDIIMVGDYLVMSLSVYEKLYPIIVNYGEFIPLKTNRGDMMLFNTLVYGKEDLQLTEVKYIDGFESGLSSLVFLDDDVTTKSLYRSNLEGGNLIYCNETFYKAVHLNNYTGLTFYKDLISIFPEE
ncbi:hypothetical protein [Shewanella sp. ALD9]|uniref:hypothetical protein n=1 Tax=Shewanella sp. ALD9 TaxID=2058330 RepID=UPI000C31E15D|nr:hypothetical protein [Shewanella sp. ALD9]PKH31973.1 hypothetical protein CXF88_08710 [Shewanella sp. ALD9]